jgi:SulP family sulfate permease
LARVVPSVPRVSDLREDAIAGVTGAVSNIPNAMANSILAGVQPVHGIYTLMVSMPTAAVASSSQLVVVLTTSAIALTASDSVGGLAGEERATALMVMALLAGVIQFGLGVLRMGQLTKFVSNAVMTGFLTGVAVLIILSQLGDLTGFASSEEDKLARTSDLLMNVSRIDAETSIVGLGSLMMMILFRRMRLQKVGLMLALVIATSAVWLLDWEEIELVQDIGAIPTSLPTPAVPDLRFAPDVLVGAAAVAAVGLIQAAGVAQNYPNPGGADQNDSRDFAAQGVANIAGGLMQGMPAGGSLSATALNVSAGARSRWAIVLCALFVVVIVVTMSGLLSLIPSASLAAVLILAAALSIKFRAISAIQQTSMTSRLTMIATFVATLMIPLHQAVMLGVVLALVIYIYQSSADIRVRAITIQDGRLVESDPPAQLPSRSVTLLDINGSMFFAGANSLAARLPAAKQADHAIVILRLRGHDRDIGSTFIGVVTKYGRELRASGGRLALSGVDQRVYERLERTGALADLEESVFLATDVIGESSEAALAAAHAWLAELDAGTVGTDRPATPHARSPE